MRKPARVWPKHRQRRWLGKNRSVGSAQDAAGWERLSSKEDTALRPEDSRAGKEPPGRGHSLGLPRQKGEMGSKPLEGPLGAWGDWGPAGKKRKKVKTL